MSNSAPLWIALLPFLGALVVLLEGRIRSASPPSPIDSGETTQRAELVRWSAVITLAAALVLSLLAIFAGTLETHFEAPPLVLPFGTWQARLTIDGASSIVLPTFLLAALIAILAAPRRALDARSTAIALGTLGSGLFVAMAMDSVTLALGWTLGAALPISAAAGKRTPSRRAVVVFRTLRVVLLVLGLALAVVGAVQADLERPFELSAVTSPELPFAMATLVLVTLAALARMAAFPFHVWLVPFVDEASPLLFAVSFAANVGLVLFLRVALPLASALIDDAVPFVAVVGLVTALHAALRALSEQRLRRLIALVVGSQLGTILVGAAALRDQAATGAMVGVASVAFGATGLLLVASAVEFRVGSVNVRMGTSSPRAGVTTGLSAAMPRASLAWFVLAFAVVGIPGSLAFVAEDLVLHGLLHAHPIFAVLALLASVLNAVTLFRAGASLFLGTPSRTFAVPDLLLRERVALVVVALLLFGVGLAPHRLVTAATSAAHSLAGVVEVEHHGAPEHLR